MNQMTTKLFAGAVLVASLAVAPNARAQQLPTASDEKRTPVVLRPNEKASMLGDMREYLKGLQEIFAALARDDMDTVAAKAQALGGISIFQTYLMFPTVSGVRFRELSALVHEDFDEIAADAKASRNSRATLEKLSVTMKRCVSCHESFYLTDKMHGR